MRNPRVSRVEHPFVLSKLVINKAFVNISKTKQST